MPFDGTEFSGTPYQAGTASGIAMFWRRAKVAAERLIPHDKASPRGYQPASPAETLDDPPARLLTMGRALIADEANWVRHCYETIGGRRCAVGALRAAARFTGSARLRDAQSLLLTVARERGYADIETMNDKSSHVQVLRAFDEAIARA